MNWKGLTEKHRLWLYVLVLFSLISMVGDIVNDRFQLVDFEVYYRTAVRMIEGAQIYRVEGDGHYVYKYAPSAALFFIPLAIFPFTVAKIIFWCLITLSTAWIFKSVVKLIDNNATVIQENKIIFPIFLLTATHIHKELHLGQVNIMILGVFVYLIQQAQNQKELFSKFLLALSIFVKPFGIIFWPYFVVRKNLTAIIKTIAFMVLLGLIPFLFYPSISEFYGLYEGWINELIIKMEIEQNIFEAENHTLFSILARYTPINFLLVSATAEKIYHLVMLGFVGLFILYVMRMESKAERPIVALFMLCAFIPLFAAVSNNSFLFSIPCFAYIFYHYKQLVGYQKIITIIAAVFVGGNIYEIWGADLHDLFDDLSICGIGGMLSVILTYLVLAHNNKVISN